jgi:hypothetical protein
MPIFFLWGFMGYVMFSAQITGEKVRWGIQTAWRMFIVALSAAYWVFGVRAYVQDVALIESEMVATAQWVANNIPEHELIAAHDIGALGFFDSHPILDLAGLVSPEIIPFMRDESELLRFLDANGVNYLIAFPDFYPQLSQQGTIEFTTKGDIAPRLGGENMVVLRLP